VVRIGFLLGTGGRGSGRLRVVEDHSIEERPGLASVLWRMEVEMSEPQAVPPRWILS
jgi:hypothetical protein